MEHLELISSTVMIIIFAAITMITLADVDFSTLSRKRKLLSCIYFIVYLILNIASQVILGFELYGDFYLLLTQFPLYILLFILTRYRGIKLIFLYLSITIFSSTAMFLSSFIIYFTHAPLLGVIPSYTLMFLVSYRYLKSPFYYILEFAETKLIAWLTIMPILYYIYNYYTTKYQYFTIITTINRDFWSRGLTLAIVLFSYCLIIVLFKMIQEKITSIIGQR